MLNAKDKATLIRQGNEYYNKKDIASAYKCYKVANYIAGIEKIGDYYFYEKAQPLVAEKFYKQSKSERTESKMSEIMVRKVMVLRKWLAEDKEDKQEKTDKENINNTIAQETEKKAQEGKSNTDEYEKLGIKKWDWNKKSEETHYKQKETPKVPQKESKKESKKAKFERKFIKPHIFIK